MCIATIIAAWLIRDLELFVHSQVIVADSSRSETGDTSTHIDTPGPDWALEKTSLNHHSNATLVTLQPKLEPGKLSGTEFDRTSREHPNISLQVTRKETERELKVPKNSELIQNSRSSNFYPALNNSYWGLQDGLKQ